MVDLRLGDCANVLKSLPGNSVDSIVTDPPYELGFMDKSWDASGIAFNPAVWREALRVLKPGGHLLAFSGSRTYHRMAVAIEDAGFEIRDQIMWVYGSGFPKSMNVGKQLEKIPAEDSPDWVECWDDREVWLAQWSGWGTALKPAHEPICMARKPLVGTVAQNVLAHGTGALNIDGCRVGAEVRTASFTSFAACHGNSLGAPGTAEARRGTQGEPKEYVGRWPANLIHDGSDEVVALFPDAKGQQSAITGDEPTANGFSGAVKFGGNKNRVAFPEPRIEDDKSAARFFYCAKASRKDRNEGCESITPKQYSHDGRDTPIDNAYQRNSSSNFHPTVKPTDLMRYLCRLVTPPGGVVLDPFMGSGSTGRGAVLEGFGFVGIEREEDYFSIAERRVADARKRYSEEHCQLGLEFVA